MNFLVIWTTDAFPPPPKVTNVTKLGETGGHGFHSDEWTDCSSIMTHHYSVTFLTARQRSSCLKPSFLDPTLATDFPFEMTCQSKPTLCHRLYWSIGNVRHFFSVGPQYESRPELLLSLLHAPEFFFRSCQLFTHSRIFQQFMEPEDSLSC
jgi:hypothetical protein